jgi:tetratricopeptide (TPR) repeat protein
MLDAKGHLVAQAVFNISREVDPDPWRNQVRDKKVWNDLAQLTKLARSVSPKQQTPQVLILLAERLKNKGGAKEAVALLRRALADHPRDFWLHFQLGFFTNDPGEKVGCFRAALTVRPNSSVTHFQLSLALDSQGDQAAQVCHLEKAIALDKDYADAYHMLGLVRANQWKLDAAIELYRKTLELNPGFALCHSNLGGALYNKGQVDQGIIHLEKAIALDDSLASAHANLGTALAARKDLTKAIEHLRKATALDPSFSSAYGVLGQALLQQGRFEEALAQTLAGMNVLRDGDSLRSVFEKQRQIIEKLMLLDKKLDAIRQGDALPQGSGELIELAELCLRYKDLPAAALRFYDAALAAEPKLVEKHRFAAACAAVRAAGGEGKDGAKLAAQNQSELRHKALAWLRAEFARLIEQNRTDVASVKSVKERLQQWLREPAFASVREPAALEELPPKERRDWRQFWSAVRSLCEPTVTSPCDKSNR